MNCQDESNGYEEIAETFIRARNVQIGPTVVGEWASGLPRGASVVDLGCGHGIPISQELLNHGFSVYGIDASSKLIAEFRRQFPNCPAERSAVENSEFFHRKFDGVVAWGLIFLLAPPTQEVVITKISTAIVPNGQFLFTAPEKARTWQDTLTLRTSVSLGAEKYRTILSESGFTVVKEQNDEGDNHYYLARKVITS